jgi:class 3 adenylate cyclase/tetratricopeptide (TPR) repeat protein
MICASCGHENPADSRFCSACGASLAAEAPAGVRKTVTVVFCDLVGSTALGEAADPEVLRELMGRYHAELRTILERHGGTVEKFVGDAAMAVFGLPQVHEDDALRATRAAVEMRDAVATLGLEVRIGVNTGEVVAGTDETLVTGDAVNVAARLEQAAEAGEVLVGAATERLVRDAVRAEAVTPLALKGKSKPVPAFRVLRVLDDVPAFTRPLETPFVGRDDELGQLDAALARAVEARSPQLLTIVGPPGIGKSRLARELLGRAQARVIVGRCLSYGEGITYWPLSEIASQVGDVRAALQGTDDVDLAAQRVGVALGTVETIASPEEIAWGFRKLFEALAQARPLIVVFDDIHWAEPALLDLIESVAAFAQDVPLVVLCTARPDLFELRPGWTTPKPNATLLTLEPLAGADSEMLVSELGDVSAEARERIVEAAEGNPLFVEQLVAMQAESGNGALEVPPTLSALLAARIDRLAEEERAVVERGSVEGRLFHRGAVVELLPEIERSTVGSHLLTLVRKELIRPDRATLPGDDGFRFGHALIRDAAYEAMPKRQRAALHERYADWLASRLGDEAPDEIVGYHLEQAYHYGIELGAGDPGLGERAAARLEAAARAARTREDLAAAVNLLRRAVALVPDGELRTGLLASLGADLVRTGDYEGAYAALEEAKALAQAAGDQHAEWFSRVGLAFVRIRREPEGAADLALREGRAAIVAREPAADHEVLARAWSVIAEAHLLRSEAREQTEALERGLEHARQTGDLTLEVELVVSSVPPILFGSVPVDEGMRHVDRILERLGDVPAVEGFGLHVLGHLRARIGQFEEAREAIDKWRIRFRELGQDVKLGMSAGCVWDVCSWAEDWAGGEQALRESYELFEGMGEKSYLSTIAGQLGEAAYRQGRLGEAERYSEICEELGASDDRLNEALWRSVRAKVFAARGDFDRAEALEREAVGIASGTDYIELAAGTWLDLAEILRAAGKAEAPAAAQEALTLYERKGNLVGASRARALLDATPARP